MFTVQKLVLNGPNLDFCVSVPAEVKPDAALDDWEAIATDEEKGECLTDQLIRYLL